MNQNGDNNYYNNDYNRPNMNQGMPNPYYQQPMPPQYTNSSAGGRNNKGGAFLLGLLVGVIIMTFVGVCAYVGTRLYQLAGSRMARTASVDRVSADSVINDDTVEKLESLEEVINQYYYRDELR